MTIKTFKNRVPVRDAESVLEIDDTPAGIRITVREEDRIVSGWFNPKQGAEIALAILEAAGVEPVSGWMKAPLMGSPEQLSVIAQKLVLWVEASESHAKEQSKLEAEAFNLYRAYMAVHEPMNAIGDWQMLAERTKKKWLAVARKAREMRAEK